MNFLLALLNQIPVIHVSCDDAYGAYRPGLPRRYSMLVLVCGSAKFYLFTIYNRRLGLFRLLRFSELNLLEPQKTIDKLTADYRDTTEYLTDEQVNLQYEFLKERFNNNEDAKSSLETRLASHITSYFALTGFYGYILTMLLPPSPGAWLAWFVFGCGCLFMIACGAFIWSGLQVKGVVRSTFKDLAADISSRTQAALAYTNWYASRQEVRALASQVKNVEMNMILALCIAVPLWIAVQFIMSRPEGVPRDTDDRSTMMTEVVNPDGTFATKNVAALLATLGKGFSSGGEKFVMVSGQQANLNRDRIAGILKLSSGEDNVRDIRLPQSGWGDASVIVKSGKGTQ
ncbi:hypothetical protein [Paraburkholderia caledonica]|uniref:TIGR04222 domain-containing membrane protein n=1 Tax=Paraburkholderia caledonica TaxID=134536 RepID=A0AB73INL4_9BURK|nr:hypothetical protein [Paraburkholderia caledonica]